MITKAKADAGTHVSQDRVLVSRLDPTVRRRDPTSCPSVTTAGTAASLHGTHSFIQLTHSLLGPRGVGGWRCPETPESLREGRLAALPGGAGSRSASSWGDGVEPAAEGLLSQQRGTRFCLFLPARHSDIRRGAGGRLSRSLSSPGLGGQRSAMCSPPRASRRFSGLGFRGSALFRYDFASCTITSRVSRFLARQASAGLCPALFLMLLKRKPDHHPSVRAWPGLSDERRPCGSLCA